MIPQFLCNSSIVAVTSHRYDNFHRQVQRRGDLFAKLKGDALKQLTKRLDKEQRDVRLCLLLIIRMCRRKISSSSVSYSYSFVTRQAEREAKRLEDEKAAEGLVSI